MFCAGDMLRDELAGLPDYFNEEVEARTPRSNFYNCLKNSAHQLFYNPKGEDVYLLAGYPWFKVRARDMFISMAACTLYLNERDRYEQLMNTAIPALRTFMREGKTDPVIHEMDQPDVLLWVVWCVQSFSLKEGRDEAKRLYGELVGEIIAYIIAQKHPNLKVTDNGLLYSDGRQKPVTWMNSVVNGRPVVPRTGYIVEFNALWYNALCFHKELDESVSPKVDRLITALELSFPATFVNQYNYLFDYVDSTPNQDWSVRPNMIIALACPYSPLTRVQKRGVLDIVTKELWTPKGLRSLSPKSEGYRPNYIGPQYERDLAYHQGPVWPWLTGMYLMAYLNLFGRGGVSFAERTLISMEEEMSLHCIGTISELFDGNPPFAGRGAISFLMSIASILAVIEKLKEYDE